MRGGAGPGGRVVPRAGARRGGGRTYGPRTVAAKGEAMTQPAPVRTLISPARYVQARGALSRLGEFLAPLGSTPLVVADDVVWKLAEDDVRASLSAADLPVTRTGMGVYATAAEVDRV